MSRESLAPSDHPDKEIRKALEQILAMDNVRFTIKAGGHWGMLLCSNGCCQIGVHKTPRVPHIHARDLLREARKCPRKDGDVRKRRERPSPTRIVKIRKGRKRPK